MTIMCVDDSNTIRMLVKKALEPEGYTVIDAENGRVGLEKLAGNDCSAFIVDVNMPEMDGFEFVENLRKDPSARTAPVVFLTTESSEEKKSRGASLGVKGWIVKPFDPPSLVKVVKMLVAG